MLYPDVSVMPKNAFTSKRAGMDTRKAFVLKHLEHAMLQSLIEYFYAAQIMQIAALHKMILLNTKDLRVFMPAL